VDVRLVNDALVVRQLRGLEGGQGGEARLAAAAARGLVLLLAHAARLLILAALSLSAAHCMTRGHCA
jgi:hypothetical protein